jgi:hypothetical protein
LPSNSICGPAFAGFPVDKPVAEFEALMRTNIINTQAFGADIETLARCQRGSIVGQINKLRYQVSLQCARVVIQTMDRLQCRPDDRSKRLGMCSGSCQSGLTSFTNLIFNTTSCPNGIGTLATHKSYENVCEVSKANQGILN